MAGPWTGSLCDWYWFYWCVLTGIGFIGVYVLTGIGFIGVLLTGIGFIGVY